MGCNTSRYSHKIHTLSEDGDVPEIKKLLNDEFASSFPTLLENSYEGNDLDVPTQKETTSVSPLIDLPDKSTGATPLHIAIYYKKYEMVQYLIESGCKLSTRNKAGWSPLHEAVWSQSIVITNFILLNSDIPSELEKKTVKGWSPLHIAAFSNNILILEKLLKQKDKFGILEWVEIINSKDNYGNTPLAYATGCGLLNNMKMLISFGADVNMKNDRGWTSLHIAARHNLNRYSIVTLEIYLKAKNTEHLDLFTNCPVHVDGTCRVYQECIEILISSGANTLAEDNYGWDALKLSSCENIRERLREY
jgi:ankyrin repeat protein